ncbi:MAG TPA: hypothetical protein VE956_03085 [Nodularia sp. (in: cyanobacteria)]|nr:hypothetical protein [Nodularia sp. (in: cyanobacteria)]
MLNNMTKFMTAPQLKLPILSLLLTLGVMGEQTKPVLSHQIQTAPEATFLVSSIPGSVRANFPTKDGTYLYGQSPEANQIGQAYVLFENRQGKIRGALYMPQSEFSCFQGAIDQSGELAMTVTGSPGEVGVNQVATANQFQIPDYNDDQMISYPYSVALQDYHQLNSISTNDQRILQMCKEIYTDAN